MTEMNILHILTLALVQGITEFLPVSSTAHLVLLPKILHWQDQGLAFDIAGHVGTLLAMLYYFRRELLAMSRAWFASIVTKKLDANSKLAWSIGFSTIPVGLVGFVSRHIVEDAFRSEIIIAVTTISFGLLLGIVYKCAKEKRNEYSITWKDVLIIGFAQVLALIPGVSRSGITLTAGLITGLTMQAAARYSFLLAIPVTMLAGGSEFVSLLHDNLLHNNVVINWQGLFLNVLFAGISGYCCIHMFLKLLNKIGLIPFVIYRMVLGILLLIYIM